MSEKFIYEIKDVKVGDIVYYKGAEKGAVVVEVALNDHKNSLAIETPEEYKPFNLFGDTGVWLRNDCFRYAIRKTPNKYADKRLPSVSETQEGARMIYDWAKFSAGRRSALGDAKAVLSDRNEDYGESSVMLADIAERWSLQLGMSVEPWRVALMMAELKLARLDHDPKKRDSWIDAINYLALGCDEVGREEEEQ